METALAAVALLLTPLGTPSGGFHWQRIITPPAGAGLREACVVLDAAIFANAAPALRDLRLFQDGAELPYVIEESYDERALNSGVTPPDDRSEYETVITVTLVPRLSGGAPSDGAQRDTYTHQPLQHGEVDPYLGTYNSFDLPQHIPVERLRLGPEPALPASITVTASQQEDSRPDATEVMEGTIDPQHPVFPVTIGANLQRTARVFVAVDHSRQVFTRVVLEMRKRSLCYQPRSAGPLMLYLGGGQGMAAKSYALANGFSTALERPYATMGPLEPNPDHQPVQKHPLSRVLLAISLLMVALPLTGFAAAFALRKQKGGLATKPSPLA